MTDRWSAPVGRPVPDDALFLQAAFGPTGDAIAVWQIRGRRQSTIHAARYHAATNSWGPIRTISAPAEEGGPSRPSEADGRPQVASGPTGDAIAVWQRPADGATLVQAAHYEASSDRWGDVDDIAGNGAETGLGPAPQVAKGAGGKAIAIWAAVVNGRNAIQAAVYGNACRGRLATHVGTAGNDVLRGTSGADVFDAGAGRDRIFGLRGNDRVCAGPGADIVRGGPGNDSMFGDAGADLLDGNAGRRDRADGGTGADRCIRVFARRSC